MDCVLRVLHITDLESDETEPKGKFGNGIAVRYCGKPMILITGHSSVVALEHWIFRDKTYYKGLGLAVYVDRYHDIAVLALPGSTYFGKAQFASGPSYAVGDVVRGIGFVDAENVDVPQQVFAESAIGGSIHPIYHDLAKKEASWQNAVSTDKPDNSHFLFADDGTIETEHGGCGSGVFNAKNELIGMVNIGITLTDGRKYWGAVKLPYLVHALDRAIARMK